MQGNGKLMRPRARPSCPTCLAQNRPAGMAWSAPPLEAILSCVRTQVTDEMLMIEKESDGCVTRLLLSGRIQSDCIACIRSAMNDRCAHKILDLGEVTLVD